MSTGYSSRRELALDVGAGLLASFLLRPTLGLAAALVTGALAGACWAALFRRSTPGLADGLMAGAAFGIPAWMAVSVLATPVLHGDLPRWSPEAMRPCSQPSSGSSSSARRSEPSGTRSGSPPAVCSAQSRSLRLPRCPRLGGW